MEQTNRQVAPEKGGNTTLARGLLWFAAILDVFLLTASFCASTQTAVEGSTNWVPAAFIIALLMNAAIGIYALSQGILFEFMVERTFKHVCSGIGFTGSADAWKVGIGTPSRVKGGKVTYPLLRNVHGTPDNWTGIIRPFAGQTVMDYTKEAEAFAQAFNAFVSFEKESGVIRIRVGQLSVPAAYNVQENWK